MKNLLEVRAELKALENKKAQLREALRAELNALTSKQEQLESLEVKFKKTAEIDKVVGECIAKYGNDFIAAVSNRFQTLSGEQLKRHNLYKKLVDDGFQVSGTKVLGRRGKVYKIQVLTTKLSRDTKTTSMSQAEFLKIHARYSK